MIITITLVGFVALTVIFSNLWLQEREDHRATMKRKLHAEWQRDVLMEIDESHHVKDFHESANLEPDWLLKLLNNKEQ